MCNVNRTTLNASTSSRQTPIYGRQNQSGFTLIEIMVVIVILAILAGLVVPKVVGQSDKARVKPRRPRWLRYPIRLICIK